MIRGKAPAIESVAKTVEDQFADLIAKGRALFNDTALSGDGRYSCAKCHPDAYAEHLVKVKRAVGVPVVASLNGTTPGGWIDFARLIEAITRVMKPA